MTDRQVSRGWMFLLVFASIIITGVVIGAVVGMVLT